MGVGPLADFFVSSLSMADALLSCVYVADTLPLLLIFSEYLALVPLVDTLPLSLLQEAHLVRSSALGGFFATMASLLDCLSVDGWPAKL